MIKHVFAVGDPNGVYHDLTEIGSIPTDLIAILEGD